jgi:hypothetical protein
VGKEGKRPLGMYVGDNIKMETETGWGSKDWNHLAQDRD